MFGTFRSHPLTSRNPVRAFLKFVFWQIRSRALRRHMVIPWVDDAKFLIRVGYTGLTGNYYYGLAEFEDMLFLMHALRADDTFVDIGSNIGSYTILASAVVKARAVSFEPVPQTVFKLKQQITINRIEDRVRVENKGVGDQKGKLVFTNNFDTTNKVTSVYNSGLTVEVDVVRIDDELSRDQNYIFKIDVEGYEYFVIEGAKAILASSRTAAVIIEINGSAEAYGFSNDDIHDALCRIGFQAVAYDPIARDLISIDGFNRKSVNSIYVKDPATIAARCKSAPFRSIHTADGIRL